MSYGVQQGDCLVGGLLLAAAVAGDEEALHGCTPGRSGYAVRALPHRLSVEEELGLPPLGVAAGRGYLDLASSSCLSAGRAGLGLLKLAEAALLLGVDGEGLCGSPGDTCRGGDAASSALSDFPSA